MEEPQAILKTFAEVVNMSAEELAEWLEQPESKRVGYKKVPTAESIGHKSGRRIVQLLNTEYDQYSPDDLKHIRKVIGFVRRHLAQRPQRDVSETNWRYSLMNWGHDPLKLVRRK